MEPVRKIRTYPMSKSLIELLRRAELGTAATLASFAWGAFFWALAFIPEMLNGPCGFPEGMPKPTGTLVAQTIFPREWFAFVSTPIVFRILWTNFQGSITRINGWPISFACLFLGIALITLKQAAYIHCTLMVVPDEVTPFSYNRDFSAGVIVLLLVGACFLQSKE